MGNFEGERKANFYKPMQILTAPSISEGIKEERDPDGINFFSCL